MSDTLTPTGREVDALPEPAGSTATTLDRATGYDWAAAEHDLTHLRRLQRRRRPTASLAASRPGREVFLDAVRVIALARVVLWHAFGAAAITYFVAAVPAMFFVTGSLLAKSLRRGAVSVIVDRCRRLLVPLWAFGLGAFAAMSVGHAIDGTPRTAVPWQQIPFWLFPINDPEGSAWEGGYLSSPLWYLRALLWLLLLSPVLAWAVRRTRGLAALAPLAGVFVLEGLARSGSFTGALAWRVGDLALYGTFLMLGFVHRQGGLDRLTRRHWAGVATVAAVAAAGWCITQPVPDHVVNDSHPAHLLVGLTWLAVLFAVRPLIERVASWHVVGAFINAVSRRSVTIYLWHSTAIVVAFRLLARAEVDLPPGVWVIALLGLTVSVTAVFILALGWVEDVSSKRGAQLWPGAAARAQLGRRARVSVVGVVSVGLAVLVASVLAALFPAGPLGGSPADASASQPSLRVPSRAPKAPVFTSAADDAVTTPSATPVSADAATIALLERTVRDWMAVNEVPGLEVALYRKGIVDWAFGAGVDPDTGASVTSGTRFDIGSVTKLFTAVLVWQAADRGLIDIDGPVGALDAVPSFAYAELTPRQLLRHTTGLVNYRETAAFQSDPSSIAGPEDALAASAGETLKFAPGTEVDYSSSNYLVLGFLLEQVTGRTYDDLLAELAGQAGLGTLPHDPPAPGLPNFSTSGLTPTAAQLARFGVALFEDNAPGLSEDALAALGDVDIGSGFGAGLMGYCPCTLSADGVPRWEAFGHTGGYAELQHSPGDDLSVAINVTDSVYASDTRYDAIRELIGQLRDIALGRAG